MTASPASIDELVRDLGSRARARPAYLELAAQPLAMPALLARFAALAHGPRHPTELRLVADLVMIHRHQTDEPALVELASLADAEVAAEAARALIGGTPAHAEWFPEGGSPLSPPASASVLAHLTRGLSHETPVVLARPLAKAAAMTDAALLVSLLRADGLATSADVDRLMALIEGVRAAPSPPLLDAVRALAAAPPVKNAEWQRSIRREAMSVVLDDPASLAPLLVHGDDWARGEVTKRLTHELATPAKHPAILATIDEARQTLEDDDLARKLDRIAARAGSSTPRPGKATLKPKLKATAKPKATPKATAKPRATPKATAKPRATAKKKPKPTPKPNPNPKAKAKAKPRPTKKPRVAPKRKTPATRKPPAKRTRRAR